jgi:lysophospholipase L1-like esterase
VVTSQRRRWLALLLAALLVSACGGSKVKLEKLGKDDVVLAFGDSLTFGTGAQTQESYPAALERNIGVKVVNAGVPGETSAEGLERLPGVLEEVRPKLLILCHGGNDFLRRLDDAKTQRNIRDMIALARSRNVAVMLLATPKPGLPPSIPVFYREIAAELALPYEEDAIRKVLLDNSLKSDLVHPNGKGYAQLAAAVQNVLRKAGAI